MAHSARASLVHRLSSHLKRILDEIDDRFLLQARIETLKKALTICKIAFNRSDLVQLRLDKLMPLEARVYEISAIIARLRLRVVFDALNDLEKIEAISISRSEMGAFDSCLGRLKSNLSFLKSNELQKALGEDVRLRNVSSDATNIVKRIRELFAPRKELNLEDENQKRLASMIKKKLKENLSTIAQNPSGFLLEVDPTLKQIAASVTSSVERASFPTVFLDRTEPREDPTEDDDGLLQRHKSMFRFSTRMGVLNVRQHLEDSNYVEMSDLPTIGTGTFGSVLRGMVRLEGEGAESEGKEFPVALKPLPPRQGLTLRSRIALRQEAYKWQHELTHPNIIRLIGFTWKNMQWYMAVELCGASLHTELSLLQGIEIDRRDAIARGLVRGIDFLHKKGVIHGNLKPSNVLLYEGDKKGRPLTVKLSGFGFRTMKEEIKRKRRKDFKAFKINTESTDLRLSREFNEDSDFIRYKAPELFKDVGDSLTPMVDMYSMGIIFWQLLQTPGSNIPFENLTDRQIEAKVVNGIRPSFDTSESFPAPDISMRKIKRFPFRVPSINRGFMRSKRSNRKGTSLQTRATGRMARASINSSRYSRTEGRRSIALSSEAALRGMAEKCWRAKAYERPRADEVKNIIEAAGFSKLNVVKDFGPSSYQESAVDAVSVAESMPASLPVHDGSAEAELIEHLLESKSSLEDLTAVVHNLCMRWKDVKQVVVPQRSALLKVLVNDVLDGYSDQKELVTNTLFLLQIIVHNEEATTELLTFGAVGSIRDAMVSFPDVEEVAVMGNKLLGKVALGNSKHKKLLFSNDAHLNILKTMKNFKNSVLVQSTGMQAMSNLLKAVDDADEMDSLPDKVRELKKRKQKKTRSQIRRQEIMKQQQEKDSDQKKRNNNISATLNVRSNKTEGRVVDQLTKQQFVGVLTRTMRSFPGEEWLQIYALGALSNLLRIIKNTSGADSTQLFAFVDSLVHPNKGADDSGVFVDVLHAMRKFKQREACQELGVHVIAECLAATNAHLKAWLDADALVVVMKSMAGFRFNPQLWEDSSRALKDLCRDELSLGFIIKALKEEKDNTFIQIRGMKLIVLAFHEGRIGRDDEVDFERIVESGCNQHIVKNLMANPRENDAELNIEMMGCLRQLLGDQSFIDAPLLLFSPTDLSLLSTSEQPSVEMTETPTAREFLDLGGMEHLRNILIKFENNAMVVKAVMRVINCLVNVGVNDPFDMMNPVLMVERNWLFRANIVTEVLVAMTRRINDISFIFVALNIVRELAKWEEVASRADVLSVLSRKLKDSLSEDQQQLVVDRMTKAEEAARNKEALMSINKELFYQLESAAAEPVSDDPLQIAGDTDIEMVAIGSMKVVSNIVRVHSSSPAVLQMALETLRYFCRTAQTQAAMAASGIDAFVGNIIEDFFSKPPILMMAFLFLERLVVGPQCRALHRKRFLWEGEGKEKVCSCVVPCNDLYSADVVDNVFEAAVYYSNDRLLAVSASRALLAFAMGSRKGYEHVFRIVKGKYNECLGLGETETTRFLENIFNWVF